MWESRISKESRQNIINLVVNVVRELIANLSFSCQAQYKIRYLLLNISTNSSSLTRITSTICNQRVRMSEDTRWKAVILLLVIHIPGIIAKLKYNLIKHTILENETNHGKIMDDPRAMISIRLRQVSQKTTSWATLTGKYLPT